MSLTTITAPTTAKTTGKRMPALNSASISPAKLNLTIQKATPSQVPAIESLIAASFSKYISLLGRLPTPMQADFNKLLWMPDRTVFVLLDGSSTTSASSSSKSASRTILGTMTLRIPDPDGDTAIDAPTRKRAYSNALQMNYFAVAPSAQGRGYGKLLLEFAERRARDEGKKALMMFSGAKFHDSVRFYKKLGYVEIGEGGEEYQRVYLRKELD